jgi:histidine triad (HIT) family protein
MKMHKKLTYFLIGLTLLVGSIYFFSIRQSADSSSSPSCAFCNQMILNEQKFYEDDLVLALYTHKPVMPGHCLIIPKRHVTRFEMLSDPEAIQINRVIKKVNAAAVKVFDTSSYLLLEKNGRECGQTVPHVHFHYIPRKEGDDSTLKFILKMYIVNFQRPIKPVEMQQAVGKMKNAID